MPIGFFRLSAATFRRCIAGLILAAFFATPAVAADVVAERTAEEFFRLLPLDIFENTGERFSEADKELLFAKGYSPRWHLAYNDADTLIVAALNTPTRTEVILHVFRGADGGITLISARTQDTCACEFWRWSSNGGLIPEAPPELPAVAEFFTPDNPLPAGVEAEIFICPSESYGELEAKPRFWNAGGPMELAPAARVRWAWNGSVFVKTVTPEKVEAK